MSYVLHYAPDNASLIVRLALEEMGVPYRTQLVDRSVQAQRSAAYRALNPAGKIPVLETPDGPIFETAAILLWLAETHGKMAPAIGTPARAGFLKWLFFASNTVHAKLRMSFYPALYAEAAPDALRTTIQDSLPAEIALLDAALDAAGGAFFGGEAPDVLDCYVAVMLRWCALYPRGHSAWFALTDYPALARMVARFEARPSVQAAIAAEGQNPAIFTAPDYPKPPKGSAL